MKTFAEGDITALALFRVAAGVSGTPAGRAAVLFTLRLRRDRAKRRPAASRAAKSALGSHRGHGRG